MTLLGEGKPTLISDSSMDAAINPNYTIVCNNNATIFKVDFGLPLKYGIELTIDLFDCDLLPLRPRQYSLSFMK